MSGSAPLDGHSADARPASFAELLIDCEEDRTLRAVLAPRTELLHVLMLPDFGSNNLGPT